MVPKQCPVKVNGEGDEKWSPWGGGKGGGRVGNALLGRFGKGFQVAIPLSMYTLVCKTMGPTTQKLTGRGVDHTVRSTDSAASKCADSKWRPGKKEEEKKDQQDPVNQ